MPVTIKGRLERLERAVQTRRRERNVFLEIEQYAAWMRHEGLCPPDPPCPRGVAPESWAERLRMGRTVGLYTRGETQELSAAEISHAKQISEACQAAALRERLDAAQEEVSAADLEMAGFSPRSTASSEPAT